MSQDEEENMVETVENPKPKDVDSGAHQESSSSLQQIVCLLCERKVSFVKIHDHVSEHIHLVTKPFQCQRSTCHFYTHSPSLLIQHCNEENHMPVDLKPRRRFKYGDTLLNTILNDSIVAAKEGSQAVIEYRGSVTKIDFGDLKSEDASDNHDNVPRTSSDSGQEKSRKRRRVSGTEESSPKNEDQEMDIDSAGTSTTNGDGDSTDSHSTEQHKESDGNLNEPPNPEDTPACQMRRRKCTKCGEMVPDRRGDLLRHVADGHKRKWHIRCTECKTVWKGFQALCKHTEAKHNGPNRKPLSILTLRETSDMRRKMDKCFPATRRAQKNSARPDRTIPEKGDKAVSIAPAENRESTGQESEKREEAGPSISPVEQEKEKPTGETEQPGSSGNVSPALSDQKAESEVCTICKQEVDVTYDVRRDHVFECHFAEFKQNKSFDSLVSLQQVIFQCFPSIAKCVLCDSPIFSYRGRNTHAARRHLKIKLACPAENCDYSDTLPDKLNGHLREHHPELPNFVPTDVWKRRLSEQVKLCFPAFVLNGASKNTEKRVVSRSSVRTNGPTTNSSHFGSEGPNNSTESSKANLVEDSDDEIIFIEEVSKMEKNATPGNFRKSVEAKDTLPTSVPSKNATPLVGSCIIVDPLTDSGETGAKLSPGFVGELDPSLGSCVIVDPPTDSGETGAKVSPGCVGEMVSSLVSGTGAVNPTPADRTETRPPSGQNTVRAVARKDPALLSGTVVPNPTPPAQRTKTPPPSGQSTVRAVARKTMVSRCGSTLAPAQIRSLTDGDTSARRARIGLLLAPNGSVSAETPNFPGYTLRRIISPADPGPSGVRKTSLMPRSRLAADVTNLNREGVGLTPGKPRNAVSSMSKPQSPPEEQEMTKCGMCTARFGLCDGAAMEKHVWVAHVKVNQDPYGCKRCQFACYVMDDIRKHWVNTHDLKMADFEFRKRVNKTQMEQYCAASMACFNKIYC